MNALPKTLAVLAASASLLGPSVANASLLSGWIHMASTRSAAAPEGTKPVPVDKSAAAEPSSGVVEKIDPVTGRVSIKHGELKNLGMPPMTMNFEVEKPMLSILKAGDKITFRADNSNGRLVARHVTILN